MEPRLPPALAPDAHKGDAGRLVCLAGSETLPGAAILATRGALRGGAGLVVLGILDANLFTIVPPAVPEAIYLDLRRVDAAEIRSRIERREPHALLVGPGLGNDARTRSVVGTVLDSAPGVPRLLDADALNALDGEPERLRSAKGPVVITPHPGEAARLLAHAVPRDEAGRIESARTLARRSGAIVCLKGRGTVVTDGDRTYVNTTGNPGMATGGTGDVLAGLLGAYLARARSIPGSTTPFDAAIAAVAVHGFAGDLAARELGERALVASDLVDFLPEAQRAFERAPR